MGLLKLVLRIKTINLYSFWVDLLFLKVIKYNFTTENKTKPERERKYRKIEIEMYFLLLICIYYYTTTSHLHSSQVIRTTELCFNVIWNDLVLPAHWISTDPEREKKIKLKRKIEPRAEWKVEIFFIIV